MTRIDRTGERGNVSDPLYAEGIRASVAEAVAFALAALGNPSAEPPLVPPALLSQAALAARNGVKLETVLRRYTAGYSLLFDFVVEEVERAEDLSSADLRPALGAASAALDCLLAAVSEEHARHSKKRALSSQEQRRTAAVKRLLEGEPVAAGKLDYDLGAVHVALVAKGPDLHAGIREIARRLDRNLLLAVPEQSTVWAWLGGAREPDTDQLQRQAAAVFGGDASVAIGEPAAGIGGWRLSHQQALRALLIAIRSDRSTVRYGEVALLASALTDEVLTRSLQQLYLDPLDEERDGECLRRTLRAYFAVAGNVSSAAAVIGASRQTVRARLQRIEERLGRSLYGCTPGIQLALELEELTS